jgi:mannitol-1-phosphate/altronate dehydrogenase
MKKIDNFKIYFAGILEEKFKLNKEQMDKYLEIKRKQENFDNKKLIGSVIGLGELVVASLIGAIDQGHNPNVAIAIIILGSVGALTAKISSQIENPYYLKEYQEIDCLYSYEKAKYKKKKRLE